MRLCVSAVNVFMDKQTAAPPAVTLAALFPPSRNWPGGFGGVLPFARHYLVETSRWLSAEEFNALLGGTPVPAGPERGQSRGGGRQTLRRPAGRRGRTAGPAARAGGDRVVLALAYDRFGEHPEVQRMLRSVAAAGAGSFGMAVRMAFAVREKRVLSAVRLVVAVAVAGLRWPLPTVMLLGIASAGGWPGGGWANGRIERMSLLADLFVQFALLSFVAFGGATALLPELYRVVVENRHWIDPATFSHLYAIAQAAPGRTCSW